MNYSAVETETVKGLNCAEVKLNRGLPIQYTYSYSHHARACHITLQVVGVTGAS